MTPEEYAISLVDRYRMILMRSETDAGQEILCTSIAKECATLAAWELVKSNMKFNEVTKKRGFDNTWFWEEVMKEINKL